ncbi:MAG: aminopeptidase P family protein [Rhodospirillaceae bacterium]|nr:aminopeptidase P family protein [Rhodospirillaceae bacterium]MBT4490580.1 aminopeptidase P family protein [Rhodospirillaceae bacterium]
MALHFEVGEYQQRIAATTAMLQDRGLDGLLMFRQESMYYLTGYDTFGFCFFQCLYLDAQGQLILLTRAPDLRQAQNTSIIDDIRIWVDRDGATPSDDLKSILVDQGCAGRRLGVEYDAYGLNAKNGMILNATLDGFCTLEDASDLVSALRMVKSPAELTYVRRAGELADDAWSQALETTAAGADEGEILAAMQGAVFKGGGDYAGNEFIIGSGGDALLCRYFTGRKTLQARDQLTLGFAGAYRHYHACMMRTIVVGDPTQHQLHMYQAAAAALDACKDALRVGRPIGAVFDAHARVMDDAGLQNARLNACGYSLGAVFAPIWMDSPMFYHGNPVLAAPGMVFFLHMILMDSEAAQAMTLGETVIVTETGHERLSSAALDLAVR